MGISGLLPLLSDIHTNIHLRELSGKTLGVDGYVWLHKGAFGCAFELVQGINTKKYVNYFMKRIMHLKEFGIVPFVVFDGANLPMKSYTEKQRHEEITLQEGQRFLKSGQKSKAIECFQTCVDVTPKMAGDVILELQKIGVEFVVAPYEADAQLAYLERIEKIDGIITEDSDLLVFGCKYVIYKLGLDGKGTLIRRKDFGKIKEFRNWTDSKFRHMCILSGCDYLESPKGIGLKKSMQLLMKTDAFKLINSWVMWGKNVRAPPLVDNYLEKFQKAEWAFLHQTVYDPILKKCIHWNPVKDPNLLNLDNLDFLGRILEPDIASGIAAGILDPNTEKSFDQENAVQGLIKPCLLQSNRLNTESHNFLRKQDEQVKQHPFQSIHSKSIMPKNDAFKAAITDNQKFIVKKTLSSKSNYFSCKPPRDQEGPIMKKKKTS